MVRTSGIRERLVSSALKSLARERGTKRPREEEVKSKQQSDDDDEDGSRTQELVASKVRCTSSSLLSNLPKPKNSNPFGPSVKLDELLKLPERVDDVIPASNASDADSAIERIGDDGMLEVDISKVVSDSNPIVVQELTIEKARPNVIVPKGKEKQKNQITYLAQLGKATELERKEQAAQSRMNKAAARSKYGW